MVLISLVSTLNDSGKRNSAVIGTAVLVIPFVWTTTSTLISSNSTGFSMFLVAVLLSFLVFVNLISLSGTLSASYLAVSVVNLVGFLVTGTVSLLQSQLLFLSIFLILSVYVGLTALLSG